MEFLAPNSRRIADFQIPGGRQTARLYDTTGPDASRKLANYLNGVVTSSSTRFFTVIPRDQSLVRDRDSALWCDDTSTRLFSAYQQSNFKSCWAQAYGSLVRHGVAAMYVEERERVKPGFNGFRYYCFSVGRFVLARNADGKVDTFMHEFDLTAKAAEAKFGRGKLSDKIVNVLEKHPYERFLFVQTFMPRSGSKNYFPIESYTCEKETRTTVREEGYPELPVFVMDWERDAGDPYPKGPGHVALPDVRSANRVKQLGLEALALQVRPPLQVPHDGVLGGQVRLTPAAQNAMLSDREIKPIELGGDLKSEMVRYEALQQAIRGVFFRDLIALPIKTT